MDPDQMETVPNVKFIVEDKPIYAHSVVLIDRSEVFKEQLREIGVDMTLILVDGSYDNFREFIKYIYEDECQINDNNSLDLLKLAVTYRVIKLENKVINSLTRDKLDLKLCNYVELNNYNLAIENENFVTLDPDVLIEFLRFNKICKKTTQMDIFIIVSRLIKSYCEDHSITLSEAKKILKNQYGNFQFGTMSQDAFSKCVERFPDFLYGIDLIFILYQIFSLGNNGLWICECRETFVWLYEPVEFSNETIFETSLTVACPTVLYGLRIGIEKKRTDMKIEISNETDSEIHTFPQHCPGAQWERALISLGDSVLLKPGTRYTIAITYLDLTGEKEKIAVWCRKETVNVIINDPNNSVHLIEASANMVEIYFKLPSE